MRKEYKIRGHKIWFRRWSNKSWAVFCSVKNIVHILHVRIGVVKQASLKQGTFYACAFLNDLPEKMSEFPPIERDEIPKPATLSYFSYVSSNILKAGEGHRIFSRKSYKMPFIIEFNRNGIFYGLNYG
jgi:hypothetical protein